MSSYSVGIIKAWKVIEKILIPNESQTKEQRNRFLNSVARNVRVWYIKVRKMAAIYHTLNMFSIDLGQKVEVEIFDIFWNTENSNETQSCVCSLDFKLLFISICSVRILSFSKVIIKNVQPYQKVLDRWSLVPSEWNRSHSIGTATRYRARWGIGQLNSSTHSNHNDTAYLFQV